ncbi:MAG: hypothetical protein LQ338_008093 [Usnochroma carphineum]|nr:MAG: hypothetical protein LQ338_008093 [Usnochroma carphineum]
MDYDNAHPERHHKGLTFIPEGGYTAEIKAQRRGLRKLGYAHGSVELCWACGWNAYNEINSDYGPRIKIFHTRDNIGLWTIGSQWMIRDQPNDCTLGNDYMTQQFLRDQPSLNIPLVKEMRRLSGPTDKIHFTLMSRAQGVSLDSVWATLTAEQKSGIKDQLADILRQIRRFTAPRPQKIDGSPLDDVVVATCARRHPPTCKKVGYTTHDWFESLAEELRQGLRWVHKTNDPAVIEEKLQELKDNFPKGEPYVLTHGDLNLSNIIVNDGRIEAIIDWEMAGYFPWWAERYLSSVLLGNVKANELFDPVWADVCPEMDEDAFYEQVIAKVAPVLIAYGQCPIDHPGRHTGWFRPGFCECKPYAGSFTSIGMGEELPHKIREVQYDFTETIEEEDWQALFEASRKLFEASKKDAES